MNNTITTAAQLATSTATPTAISLATRNTSPKRRHATLTVTPCKKRRDSHELGQAYGGRLECAGHTIWLDDAIALGVIAHVLNVGAVELRLPTFRERTSTLYAHQQQLPLDVIALYNGVSKSLLKRQNEAAEALFVRRFATALRVCTQSKTQVPSLVDWYRLKLLPAAVKAVPADLRVNERI
jgi:hypothetical protein